MKILKSSEKTFFITGTDTNSGKTVIAAAMLHKAQQSGFKTIGIKPIASGSNSTEAGLRNSDALILQKQTSVKLSYNQINPICFSEPVAPHIAAQNNGKKISSIDIENHCRSIMESFDAFTVIEGAGGWRLPLNHGHFLSDVVVRLSIPVILVVGIRLGCINHSILTAEAILNDKLYLAGWVANRIQINTLSSNEIIETIKENLDAPFLGEVPYYKNPEANIIAKHIELPHLK